MKPYLNKTIPLEAQYLYRKGREMIDQHNEDVAIIYLRQAVFIAPGFSKAYRELGNCLVRLGRTEEASVYRMKASRIDPVSRGTSGDGLNRKGQIEDKPVPGHFLTCLI